MKRIGFLLLLAGALAWSCNDGGPIVDEGDEEGEENGGGEGGNGNQYVFEFDPVTVLEYIPAPGQFINADFVPQTHAEAVEWAQQALDGNLLVSLGAFGGYITVRPSRPVINGEGYDFGIQGNPIATHNEPGVVWVSIDDKGDGQPGTWYQLAGSDEGINYTVTYTRTDEPGDVPWAGSDGRDGYVAYLPSFHNQNYYPAWCDRDGSMTLTGTLLKDNYTFENNQHINGAYGWGYADNLGKDALYNDRGIYLFNRFDISDAVDGNGNPVVLDRVDFIRVQSALLYNMASTGELSTEVSGFIIIN
ncbi:MAG: cell surface protein [Alistipes sp.]|nr:cell surface protein [Alistipes sp.]